LHITSDDDEAPLRKVWAERVEQPGRKAGAAVPRLEIIHSPYRQVIAPILDFLERGKREKPANAIGVIIPELVEPRLVGIPPAWQCHGRIKSHAPSLWWLACGRD
jgi:hypothetical protein